MLSEAVAVKERSLTRQWLVIAFIDKSAAEEQMSSGCRLARMTQLIQRSPGQWETGDTGVPIAIQSAVNFTVFS